MTKHANLRGEAQGFITDWLAPGEPISVADAELERGARIIEAQMHEIERLQRWKTEATEVIARWDDVALLVPFNSSTLGQSKADVAKREIERLRGLVREMHVYRPETFVHPTTIMWTAATCSCDDWDTLSVGVEAREAHAAHVAELLDGTP